MRIKRGYPGSLYDLAGVETWLRNLATEGLQLEEFTSFGSMGKFRKCDPSRVQFYVEPDFNQYTSEEMEKAYQKQGWHFVCELRGVFLVYETEDLMLPKPPALKPTKKQLKKKLGSLWTDLVFWLIGLPLTAWPLRNILISEHFSDTWSLRLVILMTLAVAALLGEALLMGIGKRNDIRVYKKRYILREDVESQPSMVVIRHIQNWGSVFLIGIAFVFLLLAAIFM